MIDEDAATSRIIELAIRLKIFRFPSQRRYQQTLRSRGEVRGIMVQQGQIFLFGGFRPQRAHQVLPLPTDCQAHIRSLPVEDGKQQTQRSHFQWSKHVTRP